MEKQINWKATYSVKMYGADQVERRSISLPAISEKDAREIFGRRYDSKEATDISVSRER